LTNYRSRSHRRPSFASLILTVHTKSSPTLATSPSVQFFYKISAKDYSQSPTNHGSCRAQLKITWYMTRKCWRSSTRSRHGSAT
ncbi:hypothetical protein CLOP_g21881, partial [Closterium sp. NIES-67]